MSEAIDEVQLSKTKAVNEWIKRRDKKREKMKEKQKKSVWAEFDGKFTLAAETAEHLPAGLYVCYIDGNGKRIFEHKDVNTDNLITIKNSPSSRIIAEAQKFWKLKEEFTSRGFLHKRGFLLSGRPGSGKTATINLIVADIVNNHDGIAIWVRNPYQTARCLQELRQAEKTRPVVIVMEDIDDLIKDFGETDLLALLDGEHQVDNIIFLATTNNAEKLPDRFVKRPSRFDTVVNVGMPCREIRKRYLQSKEPLLDEDELNHWVKISAGLSIAHLKEMIIMARCFGMDIDEVADKLKNFDIREIAAEEKDNVNKNPVGFVKTAESFNRESEPDSEPSPQPVEEGGWDFDDEPY